MFLKHWHIAATVALVLVAKANIGETADPTPSVPHPAPAALEEVPVKEAVSVEEKTVSNEGIPYDSGTELTLKIGVPDLRPGFQFHAGLLFLQPSSDNLGYAVLTNVKNPASPVPVASPFWEIQTLETSYQPGFEVGTTYTFPDSGKDFRADWQRLRTSNSSAVSAIDGLQWVSPFSQTGPSSAESYDDLSDNQGVNLLRSATGSVKYAYDAANFDFGQHVNVGSALDLRLFAGLSFARLQEKIESSFYGAPPDPGAMFPASVPLLISLNNTSTFTGVGPRFGFDTLYTTAGGLRLTGQLGAALLVGRTQPSQYLFSATSPELALVGISNNQEQVSSTGFTQVVYSTNARLGIGFTHEFSGGNSFSLDAGYQATVYVDPFSGYETNHNVLPLQIGSLSTASMRHKTSNFTAHGFYLSLTLQW